MSAPPSATDSAVVVPSRSAYPPPSLGSGQVGYGSQPGHGGQVSTGQTNPSRVPTNPNAQGAPRKSRRNLILALPLLSLVAGAGMIFWALHGGAAPNANAGPSASPSGVPAPSTLAAAPQGSSSAAPSASIADITPAPTASSFAAMPALTQQGNALPPPSAPGTRKAAAGSKSSTGNQTGGTVASTAPSSSAQKQAAVAPAGTAAQPAQQDAVASKAPAPAQTQAPAQQSQGNKNNGVPQVVNNVERDLKNGVKSIFH